MGRVTFGSAAVALALLGLTSQAVAHHPPRFARCQRFTFTGELERIQWTNPHVLLFIQTDSGESQQVGWLNVRRLERDGIFRDTLHVGERVTVEGGIRLNDVTEEPILLSSIRRISDGWEWSQPLNGC